MWYIKSFLLLCLIAVRLDARDSPRGLPNLGNTCFLNAMMQVLCNTSLARALRAINEDCFTKDTLALAVRTFFERYEDTAFDNFPMMPTLQKNLLAQKDAAYFIIEGEQGDPGAIFSALYNAFRSDIKLECQKALIPLVQWKGEHYTLGSKLEENLKIKYDVTEGAMVVIKNTIIKGSFPTEFEARFAQARFQSSPLDGHPWAERMLEIASLQQPLLIVTQAELATCSFPFYFTPLLSPARQYALTGIVAHRGTSIHSGHYIAYVLYGSTWYCCNDTDVVSLDKAKMADFGREGKSDGFTPFIFVYERIENSSILHELENSLLLLTAIAS